MADYQQTRDAHVLPIYEFTTQLATLEPPPPEMQQLLGAVHGNQDAMDVFVSITAGTVSPVEFFDPNNIGRIMAASARRVTSWARRTYPALQFCTDKHRGGSRYRRWITPRTPSGKSVLDTRVIARRLPVTRRLDHPSHQAFSEPEALVIFDHPGNDRTRQVGIRCRAPP